MSCSRQRALPTEEEAAWIERYRQLWAARFDELDEVIEELRRGLRHDGDFRRKRRQDVAACTSSIPRRKLSTLPAPAADAMVETFAQLDELLYSFDRKVTSG
jgi:hypothetical protein